MKLETRVFEFCDGKYANLSELAQAMGVSESHVSRVRAGKCRMNETFIVGAIKAFPEYKLDDLFYVTPGEARVSSENRNDLGRIPKQRRARLSSGVGGEAQLGRLDPYVARVLSQEPMDVQRAVIAMLTGLENIARSIAEEKSGRH